MMEQIVLFKGAKKSQWSFL